MRTVCWFSCGAASAVATKLMLPTIPDAEIVYCETGSEHEDNERFFLDCERWFGRSITRIRSAKYEDTWSVWEGERYLSGVHGAPCTRALKFRPRLEYQRPTDLHVFGYTADGRDEARAKALRANFPELAIMTPLIARGITKASTLAMIENAGIALPAMYLLGFYMNNCIPCVKSESPAYWAAIRKHFPQRFARMVELSRRLDVRLVVVAGERRFIDEIAADQPTNDPIQPACDFLCQIAEQDL